MTTLVTTSIHYALDLLLDAREQQVFFTDHFINHVKLNYGNGYGKCIALN